MVGRTWLLCLAGQEMDGRGRFSLSSQATSRSKSHGPQPSQDADTNRPAQGPHAGFQTNVAPPPPFPLKHLVS